MIFTVGRNLEDATSLRCLHRPFSASLTRQVRVSALRQKWTCRRHVVLGPTPSFSSSLDRGFLHPISAPPLPWLKEVAAGEGKTLSGGAME